MTNTRFATEKMAKFLFTGITVLTFSTPGVAQYALRSANVSTLRLAETNTTIKISYKPVAVGHPEIFRTLYFAIGSHKYLISSPYELSYFPKDEDLGIHPRDAVHGLTMDPRRFFFTGRFTVGTIAHTLLFFVGSYGINGAPLFVVGFHPDGSPYKVLALKQFNLTGFLPQTARSPSIVGKKYLSEVMAGNGGSGSRSTYATTHDPFSVFLVPPEGLARFSLIESKRYNQQHYVWAGPNSRSDYAVTFNKPNHSQPFGTLAKDLDAALR